LAQLREELRLTGAQVKKLAQKLAVQQDRKPAKKTVRTDIDFGNYHALVISINNYRNLPRLRTAARNAGVIANILERRYGFRTTLLTDATRRDILDALLGLRRPLTGRDSLLAYYAGHGVLDRDADRGYWLPRNAHEDSQSGWLSNGRITDTLKAMRAKCVMVMPDSCYSGTLTRKGTRVIPISVYLRP